MKLRVRIAAIIGTLLLGVGVAVALEAPASAGTYPHTIVIRGLCVEVPNGSFNWGEQLRLNNCNGSRSQVFNFEDAGFDWGYFLMPSYNGLCLTPGNASLFNSTIIQWPCNWGSRQTWVLGFAPDSRILYTTFSRWCLGVSSAFVGAYVTQGDCSGMGRRLMLG